MSNPFDFVNSICESKEDLLQDGSRNEREYNAWLINKALSYHSDTALYANECNFYHDLDGKLQYDYLRAAIRKGRRRSRWHKSDDSEAVALVSWRYQVSPRRAREMLDLLPVGHVDELKKIKESMTHG
jgi:hypothetical protein